MYRVTGRRRAKRDIRQGDDSLLCAFSRYLVPPFPRNTLWLFADVPFKFTVKHLCVASSYRLIRLRCSSYSEIFRGCSIILYYKILDYDEMYYEFYCCTNLIPSVIDCKCTHYSNTNAITYIYFAMI